MLIEDIKKALRIVNDMEKKGIIGKHAIGGSIGAIYWTEPFATKDLDFFLQLPVSREGGILLMPFFEYLVKRGYNVSGQYIQVGELMVDFIGVFNPLTEEALDQSIEVSVYGIQAHVLRPEYLLAIALQTGRLQDLRKVEKLYQESDLDGAHLDDIINRHNLVRKWNEFKKQYL